MCTSLTVPIGHIARVVYLQFGVLVSDQQYDWPTVWSFFDDLWEVLQTALK